MADQWTACSGSTRKRRSTEATYLRHVVPATPISVTGARRVQAAGDNMSFAAMRRGPAVAAQVLT